MNPYFDKIRLRQRYLRNTLARIFIVDLGVPCSWYTQGYFPQMSKWASISTHLRKWAHFYLNEQTLSFAHHHLPQFQIWIFFFLQILDLHCSIWKVWKEEREKNWNNTIEQKWAKIHHFIQKKHKMNEILARNRKDLGGKKKRICLFFINFRRIDIQVYQYNEFHELWLLPRVFFFRRRWEIEE